MLFDNFDMIEVHTPFADSLLRIRRIPDEVIHELRALYNEDGKDHNRYLVADVKRQKAPLLDQIKEKPNLFQFMCGVSLEFWKVYNRNYFLNVGMKNSSSKVTSAWFVDYDPGEYNPVHNHSGVFSFVLWMKIPYKQEDEQETQIAKNTNSRCLNGAFEITYVNIAATNLPFPFLQGKGKLEQFYGHYCRNSGGLFLGNSL